MGGNIHIAQLAADVGSFVLRLQFAQVFVSACVHAPQISKHIFAFAVRAGDSPRPRV